MGANVQAGLILDYSMGQLMIMETRVRVVMQSLAPGLERDLVAEFYRDIQVARQKHSSDRLEDWKDDQTD